MYPITEDEKNTVVSKLKGKSSTEFDQIPEFLVKNVFNTSKKFHLYV